MENKEYQICTNCIMDTTDLHITFDEMENVTIVKILKILSFLSGNMVQI